MHGVASWEWEKSCDHWFGFWVIWILNYDIQISLTCSHKRWIQCIANKKKLASEVLRKEGIEIYCSISCGDRRLPLQSFYRKRGAFGKRLNLLTSLFQLLVESMISKTSVPVILLTGCSCVESNESARVCPRCCLSPYRWSVQLGYFVKYSSSEPGGQHRRASRATRVQMAFTICNHSIVVALPSMGMADDSAWYPTVRYSTKLQHMNHW